MPITLPTEIITSSRVPRTATALDTTSGVKQIPDKARKQLLMGQKLAAGSQAVATVVQLLRETDSETLFGQGSELDCMAKAVFVENPAAKLYAVAVADPAGVAASGTVTFATNASGDTAYRLWIGGVRVDTAIAKNDTPTTMATNLAAAINANKNLPVTATPAAGVVTITHRHVGVNGNGVKLRGAFDANVTTTATLSGAALASGTGTPTLTSALAAVAGERYNVVTPSWNDSASGQAVRDHVDTYGQAETGRGQIAIQAVNAALSTSTTLATALTMYRTQVYAINGSDTWFPVMAAAIGAVEAMEEVATRPRNTLKVKSIKAPPVENRWIVSERRTLIDGGVSPLVVGPGDVVTIDRAVTTRVKNAANDPDYSLLDVTTILGLDYFRDAVKLMFETNYPRARWADADPDGLLPPDVATPDKVEGDLIGVAYDMEREGICENVSGLLDQFVVEKVGTNCQFSIPAQVVRGMHEKLGKIVLFQAAVTAA